MKQEIWKESTIVLLYQSVFFLYSFIKFTRNFTTVSSHPRHYEGTEYQKVTRSSLAALFILSSKLPDIPNPHTGEKPGIL